MLIIVFWGFGVWIFGVLDFWNLGFLDFWDFLDLWLRGYLGTKKCVLACRRVGVNQMDIDIGIDIFVYIYVFLHR